MKGFPLGARFEDTWFLHWGLGKVVKTLKTRVHIQFVHGKLSYDKAHTRFLRRV